MTVLALIVLAYPLAAGGVGAQDAVHVRIASNLPEAVVMADSTVVGHAGDGLLRVPASAGILRAVPPQRDAWSIAPVSVELRAAPGDTVAVDLSFPHAYKIDSEPFGASVFLEDEGDRRLLGETPMVYRTDAPLEGQLVIEQPGYVIQRLEPGNEVWNHHVAVLDPSIDLRGQTSEVDWRPPRRTRRWIDYAALGTAAVAGAVAIHYKFKADRLYEDYETTTDPALRDEIERYDTYSGVALGTMQVGLGLFAVRLVLR